MHAIVVGAGVLGASTAYHLARSGAAVTIFDRRDLGRATSAGAGIICPWVSAIDDPAYRAIASAAARYYPKLIASLHEDGEHELGYRHVGSLVVPDDPVVLDETERRLHERRVDWPEIGAVKRLTPSQAAALFPPLAPGRAAVHLEGAARVDGRLLNTALLNAAQKRGAVLRDAVSEILVSNGRVRGVRTPDGTVEADIVVVTAGAWAPALLAPLGITLDVQPQRGQILNLRVAADTSGWPVLQPLNTYYLLTFDDRRVVVGATRETGSGFDYRITAKGQAEVLNIALAVAPGLADAEVIETRIGFRPMGPNNRPLLGPCGGIAGLLVGNGLGPSGLTIGPYAGALLADAARNRAPDLDLEPYSPEHQDNIPAAE
jgi:D-amino-acid dehydrogenase